MKAKIKQWLVMFFCQLFPSESWERKTEIWMVTKKETL